MGYEWIQRVIEALQEAGIRAQRGYPAGKNPCLESPVASVCMEKMQTDSTVLAVWIYSPVSMGGTVCEDTAFQVVPILNALGGQCRLEGCSFHGKAGVFAMPVYVTFCRIGSEEGWSVKVAGVEQVYAIGFKAEYLSSVGVEYDSQTGSPYFSRRTKGWQLTIEELLPKEHPAEEENMNTFTVEYTDSGGVRRFQGCFLERVLLETTAEGYRRTRIVRSIQGPVINP